MNTCTMQMCVTLLWDGQSICMWSCWYFLSATGLNWRFLLVTWPANKPQGAAAVKIEAAVPAASEWCPSYSACSARWPGKWTANMSVWLCECEQLCVCACASVLKHLLQTGRVYLLSFSGIVSVVGIVQGYGWHYCWHCGYNRCYSSSCCCSCGCCCSYDTLGSLVAACHECQWLRLRLLLSWLSWLCCNIAYPAANCVNCLRFENIMKSFPLAQCTAGWLAQNASLLRAWRESSPSLSVSV